MDEFRFVTCPEAAVLAGRSQQTIRVWAANGQVRRRCNGRVVEYHVADVLVAAGLRPLDDRDRQLAELRLELERVAQERDRALEIARRRQQKIDDFQRRATARYAELERSAEEHFANICTQYFEPLQQEVKGLRQALTRASEQIHSLERQAAYFQREAERFRKHALQILRLVPAWMHPENVVSHFEWSNGEE